MPIAQSRERFGGHGSAMAQAYNHMIMPLASPRDRATQVRWGIADFKRRFKRAPEGMWLPECAVDTATLEALAAEGILFTVLAPHQAKAWRPAGGEWRTTPIDPGRAYKCKLPSGRSIDLFFYDGQTAQAVAFERLLSDGHQIIARMTGAAAAEGERADAVSHRDRRRDLRPPPPLRRHGARVGAVAGRAGLERHAAHELRRVPREGPGDLGSADRTRTARGAARTASRAGARTAAATAAGSPGWNQKWRRPLRDALDWLRDQAAAALESVGGMLFKRSVGRARRVHRRAARASDAARDAVPREARERTR